MPKDDPNDPVLLARCANEFEAELKASVVRAAGIEVRTVTTAASTLWHIGPALGYPYDVFVKRGDLERAKAALDEAAASGRAADWREVAAQADVGDPVGSSDDDDDGVFTRPRRRGLPAPIAFAMGAVGGLLTSPVPVVIASLIGAPMGRPEMTVMVSLWVFSWSFLAYNIRERLPAPVDVAEAPERGRERRGHFRDSRLALAGWFLLGAAFFGPVTAFLPALALMPLTSRVRPAFPAIDAYMLAAWSVGIGVFVARQAWRAQRKRRAALGLAR